jgi:hypothetical protein
MIPFSQIAKILSAPVPKPGELIKLDASPNSAGEKDKEKDRNGKAVSSALASLEMICRMPGGLDFGKGLVDVNFQMWPLFCCLSLDNILTCCEVRGICFGFIVADDLFHFIDCAFSYWAGSFHLKAPCDARRAFWFPFDIVPGC